MITHRSDFLPIHLSDNELTMSDSLQLEIYLFRLTYEICPDTICTLEYGY